VALVGLSRPVDRKRLRTLAIVMAPVLGLIFLAGLLLVVARVYAVGLPIEIAGACLGWVNYLVLRRTRPRSN
jgi:hypothetical protein